MLVSLPIVKLTLIWSGKADKRLRPKMNLILGEDSIPAIPSRALGAIEKAFPKTMFADPDLTPAISESACWPA
jgi:hypothetical protein